jgi:hypothetical protein
MLQRRRWTLRSGQTPRLPLAPTPPAGETRRILHGDNAMEPPALSTSWLTAEGPRRFATNLLAVPTLWANNMLPSSLYECAPPQEAVLLQRMLVALCWRPSRAACCLLVSHGLSVARCCGSQVAAGRCVSHGGQPGRCRPRSTTWVQRGRHCRRRSCAAGLRLPVLGADTARRGWPRCSRHGPPERCGHCLGSILSVWACATGYRCRHLPVAHAYVAGKWMSGVDLDTVISASNVHPSRALTNVSTLPATLHARQLAASG